MANGLLNNIFAYYKFDELTSTANAVDSGPFLLNLTRVGSPGVGTGLLNGYRHTASSTRFTSTDPNFIFGDEDATFLGFFRPQSVTGLQGIFSRYDTTANVRSYSIRLNATALNFVISQNGTGATAIPFTGLVIAINVWYFVCVRYTAATDQVDISVTPVTEPTVRAFQSTTFPGGFYSGGTVPFAFGSEYVNAVATNVFTGEVDEWAMYVGALTNTQVSQYYNGGVPLGYPNFDTGGGAAQDLAGTSAGIETITGALALAKPLASTSAGIGTTAVALALSKPLGGASAGIETVSGALGLAKRLAAVSAGVGSVTGALSLAKLLATQSAGIGNNSGELSLGLSFSGASAGASTNTGNLTIVVPVQAKLAGSTSGLTIATGDLKRALGPLAGTAPGISTPSTSLSVRPRSIRQPVVAVATIKAPIKTGRDGFKKQTHAALLPPPRWPDLPKEIAAKFPSLAKPIAEYNEKGKDFFRQQQESQK